MAYEPKTWACGDTITADALNHLERGVEEAAQGGGIDVMTVNVSVAPGGNHTADKTYSDLESLRTNNKPLVVCLQRGDFIYHAFAQIKQSEDGRGLYDRVIVPRTKADGLSDTTVRVIDYVIEIAQNSSIPITIMSYGLECNGTTPSTIGWEWQ